MAKDIFTAEELGIGQAPKQIFTAEELGIGAPAQATQTEQPDQKQIFTAEQLGLPSSELSSSEPSVFQRVKDIAASPIEAIMGKDVFKESAPTDEKSPFTGSVKKGLINVQQSVVQNQLASLMELQAADKEKYGETYEKAPASELDKISARDKAIQDKLRTVAEYGLERRAIDDKHGVFDLAKSLKDTYASKSYEEGDFLDRLKMIGSTIADNPSGIPGWIAGVGVESLPQSMATVAAALAARTGGMGPKAAAVAGGSSSAFMEFGGQYAELRAQGLDHKEAWEKAGVKSGVIGIFDAASFNSAGNAASTVIKGIEKGAFKDTAKQVGKEIGVQSLYGGAGEALGSVAINQRVDPGAVLEEMVGEVFGAPVEAVSTYKQNRAKETAPQETPLTTPLAPEAGKLPEEAQVVPPAPAAEVTPAAERFFAEAQTRYQELGFSRKDAERLANEEIKETGSYGDRAVTGAVEPSLPTPSVPTELRPAAEGIAGVEPGRMDVPSGTPGAVGRGEEVQLPALESVQETPAPQPSVQEKLDNAFVWRKDGVDTPIQVVAEKLSPGPTGKREIVALANNEEVSIPIDEVVRNPEYVAPTEVLTPEPTQAAPTQVPEEAIPTANGVPITKGKRGRPVAQLTPEQAAEKAAARKGSQAATRNAIRTAEKAEKILANEFDPSEFESIDAAQVAQSEFNEARRQALEDLHALSISPAHRNNKAGTVAKRLLTQANPQERQLAQDRYEAKKKAGVPNRAEFIDATNGADNSAYLGFKDAKQAMSWLARTGNAFEKDMARRLASFVKDTKLVIVRSLDDLPTPKLRAAFEGAGGMYFKNVIYLAAEGGINNTIFLHEALHNATINRIDQWQKAFNKKQPIDPKLDRAVTELYRTMFEAKDQFEALKEAGMVDDRMLAFEAAGAFDDVKEFVAYGMSHPTMQEFLMQTPGFYAGEKKGFISDLFNRFVQSLRSMFNMGESHKSAFQDLIIVTEQLLRAQPEQVVSTAEAAPAKKSTQKIDKDMEKVRISNSAFESTDAIGDAINNHKFEDYKDLLNARFDAMGSEFIKKILYAMQTVDIIRWKGDDVAALKDIDELQQEMSTMRVRILAASAKKADQLGNFIRKNGMKTLGSTMHLARLKKVSPTQNPDAPTAIKNDPVIKHYEALLKVPGLEKAKMSAYKGKITIRTNDINAVYKMWDALGKQKGGHEMYEMVRQFYKDNYTAMRTLLDDQLNALPIDDEAKAKLLKSVRLMQEQTKAGADEDFDNMERTALPEEYFPFKRDGKYWLRVAEGPTGREFYLFDSGVSRNQFLLKRAKELGKNPNDGNLFSKGDDITSLRKNFQDSSMMLQEMFATIEDTAENPKFDQSKYKDAAEAHAAMKEELKDQLYQVYLMTMPERSFRKQFIHADEITGFSADIFRNFKTSANSFANQLAKLKYSTEIENRIQSGRDSLEGMPTDQRAKLELFVNEIATRAREEINPPEQGEAVTRINQFAFLMLLTSAASAATQMASVPVMVMPTLNQEYGYGQAAAKFAKYLPVWKSVGVTETAPNGEVSWVAPTMGASSMVKNNPILQRAFEAGVDRNVTGLTNASVLTNKNRTPDNSYTNAPQVVARVGFNAMTALFSGAERMSREITYMMTFELEYAKTKNFDASVQKAIDTTHELLGRYDNFNRPRILRNALGKTIGQFKQYAVFMTSWMVRNAYTMFSEGLTKKEGRDAMHRLAGTLIMGGMFHGLVGMPLYSTICAVVDAALDGDDEERKLRRAKNPLTADSSNLRFRYEWLPEHFGEITMPGLDGRKHRLSEMLEKGPISALTDINIGSRTSLDGMWWREAKPGKNYLETAQNYILANMGPGVSTGVNMVGAIDDFTTGHVDRGLEKLVPAFFKGSLVATRLGTEGAETKGGADLLKKEEINTLNLIAAALGFNPTRLARIQEKNFEMQKQVTEAQNKRTALLRQLDETAFDTEGDKKDVRAVMEKINEFNRRYPADGLLIDIDTIEKSLEAYGKKRGMTFRGQYISEKMLPYLAKPTKAVVPLE